MSEHTDILGSLARKNLFAKGTLYQMLRTSTLLVHIFCVFFDLRLFLIVVNGGGIQNCPYIDVLLGRNHISYIFVFVSYTNILLE